jgi:hypothetical protein
MIKTNRATRLTLTAFVILAGTMALASLQGCASDKPAPPPAAPPAAPPPKPTSLTQIKSELLQAKAQLQVTNDSLNKLQKSSTADADANYNRFTEQQLKLQAEADALSKRSKDLKDRATAYQAMWNQQADVQNPELRRQAVQQKADAERIYNSINSDMELARLSFQPYMANLKDVTNYLRGNVSPANLQSAGDLVQKANGQAKQVDSHLAALVTSIDKITSATGEGAAGKAADTSTGTPAGAGAGAATPAAPAAAPAK